MNHLKYEIKWAVIYSVFLLLWSLAGRLSGLHDKYLELEQDLSLFLLIPAVATYILMLVEKRKHFYAGNMSYIQGLKSGIGLTFFILVLTPVVQLISNFIISPDYFKNLAHYAVSKGIMSEAEAAKQFSYSNYTFVSMVFQLISGSVFAAFVPLFLPRRHEATKDH